jgi:hypothetical protein
MVIVTIALRGRTASASMMSAILRSSEGKGFSSNKVWSVDDFALLVRFEPRRPALIETIESAPEH